MPELTEEQRDARKRGIGGSDVGPLLGLSKWTTPVELWAYKTGKQKREDISEEDRIIFGHLLEETVCNEFSRRLDIKVIRQNQMKAHPEREWMLANIDRRCVATGSMRAGLEAKTSSAWVAGQWGESGTDDVPLPYLCQCLHYLEVTGWDVWYLAVLIGGNEFRWYQIERKQDTIDSMVQREQEFWQCVLDETPPEAIALSDLSILYPKSRGAAMQADDAMFKKLGELAQCKSDVKAMQDRAKSLQLGICDAMGEHDTLLHRDGSKLATWRQHDQTRIDTKRLKNDEPDTYELYSKTTSVRPFRLSI